MPIPPFRRLVAPGVVAFMLVAWVAIALREVINSSRFQLFGDYLVRVETSEKVVAITFDDGPHPVHTPRVLDVLDRHRARATFFMMGVNVERYPDVARDVVRRGHEVGNHSYSHRKLVFMWPASVREEIARTDALLRGVGVTGEIHFRTPHAAKFIVLPYILSEMGKLNVLGDVDPEEWTNPPAATMTATILRDTRPGSIIGMHDPLGAETLQALDASLTELKAQGYRFETISELLRR